MANGILGPFGSGSGQTPAATSTEKIENECESSSWCKIPTLINFYDDFSDAKMFFLDFGTLSSFRLLSFAKVLKWNWFYSSLIRVI